MKRFILIAALSSLPGTAWGRNVNIHWSPIKGAHQYELHINGENSPIQKNLPGDTTVWNGEVPAGAYTYRVRGIDRLKQPGKWSEPQALLVAPNSPQLLSPLADTPIEAKPTTKVNLKWKESSGATHYYVEVKYGRRTLFKKSTTETQIETVALAPGRYSWTCRASVELSGKAPKDFDASKGQSAFAKEIYFNITPPGARRGLASEIQDWIPATRSFQIDLDLTAGSYDYVITGGGAAFDGHTSTITSGIRAALGYRPSPNLLIQMGVQDDFYKVNSVGFGRKLIHLGGEYQLSVGSFLLSPFLFLQARDYFALKNDSGDETSPPSLSSLTTLGPQIGLNGAWKVSTHTWLETRIAYFKPIKLATAPADTLLNGGSGLDAALGVRYFLGPDWAFHGELGYFSSPANFVLSGESAERVTTYTSIQGFVGLSYQLGSVK